MPNQRVRSFLPRLAAGVLLVGALSGCGGDEPAEPAGESPQAAGTPASDVPQPAETAQEYADRWAAALREEDCETLADIYGYVPEQLPEACEQVAANLRGIEITGVDQYGPAALIRFRAPESETAAVREDAVQPAVMLDATDGRFTDAGSLIGVSSFLAESYGGAPRLPEETRDAAERYVEIIRERDCDALFDLELTPQGGTKKAQCRSAFEGSLPPALDEAPDAQIESLGGSGGWTFYGLRAGTRYFVIPTLVDSRDNDDVDVLGYFRAAGPPTDG